MDWICMVLFKTPKAPDRVPGSIHSHTVILVVVNPNSSHSCPRADWRKRGCHSAPTGPPTTTSNIQQSYAFTRGKVGEVSCPLHPPYHLATVAPLEYLSRIRGSNPRIRHCDVSHGPLHWGVGIGATIGSVDLGSPSQWRYGWWLPAVRHPGWSCPQKPQVPPVGGMPSHRLWSVRGPCLIPISIWTPLSRASLLEWFFTVLKRRSIIGTSQIGDWH